MSYITTSTVIYSTHSRTSWLNGFCRLPKYSPIICLLRPFLCKRNLDTALLEFSRNLCSIRYLIPFSGFLQTAIQCTMPPLHDLVQNRVNALAVATTTPQQSRSRYLCLCTQFNLGNRIIVRCGCPTTNATKNSELVKKFCTTFVDIKWPLD